MPTAPNYLKKSVAGIRAGVRTFVLLCYGYMVVAVLVQVVGRYVFNYSIAGTDESATFAQVWLAVMGAGIAMQRGTVFAIDALPALLPIALQRVISVLIVVTSVAFLCVIIYGSFILIDHGRFQTSPSLQIPMWWVYVMIPIGMTYFGLEVVLRAIERWDHPFKQLTATEGDAE